MEQQQTGAEKYKRKRPGPRRRRPESRRHKENKAKVDNVKQYPEQEAINLLKTLKNTKFDETVQIAMKLGIDPKKSDQALRGSVSLPKGIGKNVKVLAFAEGDLAEQAKAAGADVVGGKELVDKIQTENWVDFDIAIAHPGMMRFVGKLGKVLGPKGKMPAPKAGTVREDIAQAVKEFKSGRVEYRTDSGGNIHAGIGKKSFSADDLLANIDAFIEHIKSIKPATAKGTYMQKISLSSTMSPNIWLEIKK
jgi:large subunit ribosomal protein L1